jgi:hypothetical protein
MGWLGHHRKFSYVHRIDVGLLLLNLIYLLTVCLVPFASGVLSEHSGRIGFTVYAVIMAQMLNDMGRAIGPQVSRWRSGSSMNGKCFHCSRRSHSRRCSNNRSSRRKKKNSLVR